MKNGIGVLRVIALAGFFHITCKGQTQETVIDGLSKASFMEAHIDSNKIAALADTISRGVYNIHSLLILRNNKLVSENYFRGSDEILGTPLGVTSFTRDSLHDCRSLTKSVVSCCIGIAIAQHKIKNVNDRILAYLPGYAKYDTGMKHAITIKDLLTMSAGLEWNENIPYNNPANSEIQMFGQKDVIDFVLSRPAVAKPGTTWNYSGGCTQLLAEILQRATGEKIDSFARKYIFAPLGIKQFSWYEREDGEPWAPSGLRLRPLDMAKFGLLYLNKGQWQNRQVVSAEWVQQSLQWQINARSTSQGYGYQFWCTTGTLAHKKASIAVAIGYGGQRIYLIPGLGLEIVVTAGNYNDRTDLPDELVFKSIFPAIEN